MPACDQCTPVVAAVANGVKAAPNPAEMSSVPPSTPSM
jgi:hypothetical protein